MQGSPLSEDILALVRTFSTSEDGPNTYELLGG